jgi:phosphoribosylamine--glycine ligase
MNVLVIGGGGREHALAWKLAQSPRVARVYVAPGNGGTARADELTNVPLTEIAALVEFARRESVGLTVVGPEAPLAAGMVDAFRGAGLRIFGPTRAAAQLESSKDFAKTFMGRHHIPTAASQTFTSAPDARAYVTARGAPIVVKADGLAAGKGVVVAATVAEAHAAIDRMLVDNAMGAAGARVVIEDFLAGEEASFIVMVDGAHVLPLASSQDHKRLRDTPQVHARIMREVIMPTVQGMAADGIAYSGFLYAGVMLDAGGAPRVLEFNCRLGDPETQPIVVRLRSDLLDLLEHGVNGTLDRAEAQWDRRAALGVVLAAGGYPDAPRTGAVIEGLDRIHAAANPDVQVFHAGTALDGDRVVVSGGRVLCVTALGDSVRQAQRAAYNAIAGLHFDGMQYRTDIGHRALARRG